MSLSPLKRLGIAAACAVMSVAAASALENGSVPSGTGTTFASASTLPARSQPGLKLVPPPAGRMYHAAYPDFRDTEDFVTTDRIRRFERLAGRRIAWAYFSNNWGKRIRFPSGAVRRIHAAGSVPFIRLMARNGWRATGPDPKYTLQRIIDGDFDTLLTRWGRAAARWGKPILVEFGTEVNGSWFPWNGAWNGGGRTTAFGDPARADGPERFRVAYRHVRDAIEAGGARNLTWFFHVDDNSLPVRRWNSIASYYPGDGYVDWVGVSVYGPLTAGEPWAPGFARAMRRVYPRLAALSDRPIALLEFGSRQGRRKAGWFREALKTVASRRYPRLRAVSVWSEAWKNNDGSTSNLRIDSDRRTLRTYRRFARRPVFASTSRFRRR